jgi:UDP-glucose 4-epimerase
VTSTPSRFRLALRFFNVFGPLQPAGHAYAAVVPLFLAAALEGRPLLIQGDGLQSRDFTFVDTVTEIIEEHHDAPATSSR